MISRSLASPPLLSFDMNFERSKFAGLLSVGFSYKLERFVVAVIALTGGY